MMKMMPMVLHQIHESLHQIQDHEIFVQCVNQYHHSNSDHLLMEMLMIYTDSMVGYKQHLAVTGHPLSAQFKCLHCNGLFAWETPKDIHDHLRECIKDSELRELPVRHLKFCNFELNVFENVWFDWPHLKNRKSLNHDTIDYEEDDIDITETRNKMNEHFAKLILNDCKFFILH